MRYTYKAYWSNPNTDKKELPSYSNKFKSSERAKEWYKDFGVNLEKMFKRKLVLVESGV